MSTRSAGSIIRLPNHAALFSLWNTARRFFTICLPCCLLAASPVLAGGGALLPASLVSNGGILVTKDRTILHSLNPDTPMVPASTWKIATALEALTLLGPEHRFETRCLLGPDQTLYIQGSGDPMLVSEEVSRITQGLRDAGVRQVAGIVLDDSAFNLATPADGASSTLNPYDVMNSGLAVNFNTINIIKDQGGVRSAESQTPTLPLMAELAASLPPGTHRINISQQPEQVWRYAGELFQAQLRATGIIVRGAVRPGPTPTGLPVSHTHCSSHPLTELIAAMLRHSSNFMANQLFLACGARQLGQPATWDKGRQTLDAFLRNTVRLPAGSFTVEEGSGLSRKNRITPRAMLGLLQAFAPHASLLSDHDGVPLKSGTLTGVYAYAGYLPGPTGLDPFVLLLNQPKNTRDQVLTRLMALHDGR